jgi:hypothetical protein
MFISVLRASVPGLLLTLALVVVWRGDIVHEVGFCSRCDSLRLRTRYLLGQVTVFSREEKISKADWAAWNKSITADSPHCRHAWQWSDAAGADRLFALHRATRGIRLAERRTDTMIESHTSWYQDYRPRLLDAVKQARSNESADAESPDCGSSCQWRDAKQAHRVSASHRAIGGVRDALQRTDAMIESHRRWYEDYRIRLLDAITQARSVESQGSSH